MKVALIGTGYVGLVVGACLAETGNDVICADVDEEKIERLNRDQISIHEPGLELLVVRNHRSGRLHFTTDVAGAVRKQDIIFIAVATPPDEDGTADLQHVLDVATTIGRNMNRPKIVATKSTVPVGTAERLRAAIAVETEVSFHVCSNPEFLKEGGAVDDFMKPDRVIVGANSDAVAATMRELYAPFVRTGNPILVMDIASAEMTKYAANAMLAARISFMNEIAELCEKTGADVAMVRQGMATDRRIGSAFLFPGAGYGGSCFPKDVRALIRTAEEEAVPMSVVQAVHEANERQKKRVLQRVLSMLEAPAKARVAIWGLAFKPETDDMREAPSLVVIDGLLRAGAHVVAHDPAACANARACFGDRVMVVEDAYQALDGVDALGILTEWLEYRNPDFERMIQLMARPVIVDARNIFDPIKMRQLGFTYTGIGRPNA